MSRKTTSRSRGGRPPIHDQALIRRLLVERERTGESYASLSARSGIPAGTLMSWSHRRGRKKGRPSSFVELVVAEDELSEPGPVAPAFDIVLKAGGVERVVSVPAGFDAADLQRLIKVLEETC